MSSIWRGASGLWVAVAGHCEEQRPHSVQVNMSSTCFQVKWSMRDAPKRVAFSRSCLESCPSGSSLRKKTLGSEVMMWKCLASGRKFKKVKMTRLCAHHAALPAAMAKPGPPSASSTLLIAYEKGSHHGDIGRCPACSCATMRPPSYTRPELVIVRMKQRIRYASQCGWLRWRASAGS